MEVVLTSLPYPPVKMHLNLEKSPTQSSEYEMGTPTSGSVLIHTEFEL